MVCHLGHPAHTAILGLPGVEIHESGEWLSEDCERDPKDDVSQNAATVAEFHLFERSGDGNKRKLKEHAKESDT